MSKINETINKLNRFIKNVSLGHQNKKNSQNIRELLRDLACDCSIFFHDETTSSAGYYQSIHQPFSEFLESINNFLSHSISCNQEDENSGFCELEEQKNLDDFELANHEIVSFFLTDIIKRSVKTRVTSYLFCLNKFLKSQPESPMATCIVKALSGIEAESMAVVFRTCERMEYVKTIRDNYPELFNIFKGNRDAANLFGLDASEWTKFLEDSTQASSYRCFVDPLLAQESAKQERQPTPITHYKIESNKSFGFSSGFPSNIKSKPTNNSLGENTTDRMRFSI